MKKKTSRKVSIRAAKGPKRTRKPFIEPEIVEQEPLKRVVQQTCSVSSTVLCFG